MIDVDVLRERLVHLVACLEFALRCVTPICVPFDRECGSAHSGMLWFRAGAGEPVVSIAVIQRNLPSRQRLPDIDSTLQLENLSGNPKMRLHV